MPSGRPAKAVRGRVHRPGLAATLRHGWRKIGNTCCTPAGGGASSTTCRARGYTYIGSGCDNSPQCSSWGSGGRCCAGGEGYCGSEWSSSNPGQWISVGSCTGTDFIRVSPGCGIEVATSGNGGGSRYTYNGDAILIDAGTRSCAVGSAVLSRPPPSSPTMQVRQRRLVTARTQ